MAAPLPLSPVRGLLLLLGFASRANYRELGPWPGAVGPCGGRAGRARGRAAVGVVRFRVTAYTLGSLTRRACPTCQDSFVGRVTQKQAQ